MTESLSCLPEILSHAGALPCPPTLPCRNLRHLGPYAVMERASMANFLPSMCHGRCSPSPLGGSRLAPASGLMETQCGSGGKIRGTLLVKYGQIRDNMVYNLTKKVKCLKNQGNRGFSPLEKY